MTDEDVSRWVDSIALDLANVASADDCVRLRALARTHVYASRGLKVPEFREPLWDLKRGQVR